MDIESIKITVGSKALFKMDNSFYSILPPPPSIPEEDIKEKVKSYIKDNNIGIDNIIGINYIDNFTCYLTYKKYE